MRTEALDQLRRYPVIAAGSKLALGLIDGATVSIGGRDVYCKFSSPSTSEIGQVMIVDPDPRVSDLFPAVVLADPPLDERLSQALFRNWDTYARALLRQSQIPDEICREALGETVVLMVADGLSYGDLNAQIPVQPCLVDVPTTTECGHANIVGSPTIAHRLFKSGYRRFIGFSFWERDVNRTAQTFFRHIPDTRTYRFFEDIVEGLKDVDLSRAYIQISMSALDQCAHSRRDAPLISSEVSRVVERALMLRGLLRDRGLPSRIYLTSDHGLMWVDPADSLKVIAVPDAAGARYCRGLHPDPYTRYFASSGLSCLQSGYITRRLRSDEKGLHGGISCGESLIPLWRLVTWEDENDAHWTMSEFRGES